MIISNYAIYPIPFLLLGNACRFKTKGGLFLFQSLGMHHLFIDFTHRRAPEKRHGKDNARRYRPLDSREEARKTGKTKRMKKKKIQSQIEVDGLLKSEKLLLHGSSKVCVAKKKVISYI